MLGLILAGGRGARFGGGEKPLALCNGLPLIERVADALREAKVEPVVVASPRTPYTQNWCRAHDILCICTGGAGYVEDLVEAVSLLGLDEPVLTVAADLPCLSSAIVEQVVRVYRSQPCPALSVWVPVGDGASALPYVDVIDGRQAIPAGINVLHAGQMGDLQEECRLLIDDPSIRHNVNTRAALTAAERHLAGDQLRPDPGVDHRKRDNGPGEI